MAAFALVAALIAVPLARNAGGSSEIAPNSIGVLDPDSGEVIATLELEARPGSIVASADDVWVTNPDVDTVTRIDPQEQAIVDTIPVGENPTAIAVGEGRRVGRGERWAVRLPHQPRYGSRSSRRSRSATVRRTSRSARVLSG